MHIFICIHNYLGFKKILEFSNYILNLTCVPISVFFYYLILCVFEASRCLLKWSTSNHAQISGISKPSFVTQTGNNHSNIYLVWISAITKWLNILTLCLNHRHFRLLNTWKREFLRRNYDSLGSCCKSPYLFSVIQMNLTLNVNLCQYGSWQRGTAVSLKSA